MAHIAESPNARMRSFAERRRTQSRAIRRDLRMGYPHVSSAIDFYNTPSTDTHNQNWRPNLEYRRKGDYRDDKRAAETDRRDLKGNYYCSSFLLVRLLCRLYQFSTAIIYRISKLVLDFTPTIYGYPIVRRRRVSNQACGVNSAT